MSLVSARNLVAPLTNMVHLITILLVAIAFAVLRFSGASLSMGSSSTSRQQVQPAVDQRLELDKHLRENRKPMPWEQEKRDVVVPPLKKNPADKGSGGLDDIEKALGM